MNNDPQEGNEANSRNNVPHESKQVWKTPDLRILSINATEGGAAPSTVESTFAHVIPPSS